MIPTPINYDKNIPRSDYPRPAWVRDGWYCLNGEWEFAYDYGKSGEARGMVASDNYPLTITVPFCPESRLSGIENIDFIPAVWYRKTFDLSGICRKRTILHFGAVDYVAKVFLNGKLCGTHKGGYTPFEFDVTDLLNDGENTLVVYAEDDLRGGRQNFGKQSLGYRSSNCSYTRVTGIWQSVWLEFVPDEYLKNARIIPHASAEFVEISTVRSSKSDNYSLLLCASYCGREVASSKVPFVGDRAAAMLSPSEIHLWNPGAPEIYDLTLTLLDSDNNPVDSVSTYFALRDVSFDSKSLLINGKRVFMRLILDQGYNPDGINTAPDVEYLKRDIELSMGLGFNGARFHQRVFEESSLYYADKLGYMVWAEMPSGIEFYSTENIDCYLPEWLEIVNFYYNHPSVIGWCPHNETYHQDAIAPYSHVGLYDVTKALDPYRPVIDASGGTHYKTDMFDTHVYEQNPQKLAERLEPMKNDPAYAYTASTESRGVAPLRIEKYEGQAYWLSEFGGAFWNPHISEEERGWGYGSTPKNEEEFVSRYEELTRILLEHPRVCGFCYTQLTDVEQEQNGLFCYTREEKLSRDGYERIRRVNLSDAAIEAE